MPFDRTSAPHHSLRYTYAERMRRCIPRISNSLPCTPIHCRQQPSCFAAALAKDSLRNELPYTERDYLDVCMEAMNSSAILPYPPGQEIFFCLDLDSRTRYGTAHVFTTYPHEKIARDVHRKPDTGPSTESDVFLVSPTLFFRSLNIHNQIAAW